MLEQYVDLRFPQDGRQCVQKEKHWIHLRTEKRPADWNWGMISNPICPSNFVLNLNQLRWYQLPPAVGHWRHRQCGWNGQDLEGSCGSWRIQKSPTNKMFGFQIPSYGFTWFFLGLRCEKKIREAKEGPWSSPEKKRRRRSRIRRSAQTQRITKRERKMRNILMVKIFGRDGMIPGGTSEICRSLDAGS